MQQNYIAPFLYEHHNREVAMSQYIIRNGAGNYIVKNAIGCTLPAGRSALYIITYIIEDYRSNSNMSPLILDIEFTLRCPEIVPSIVCFRFSVTQSSQNLLHPESNVGYRAIISLGKG
jgi:hypothetical protein